MKSNKNNMDLEQLLSDVERAGRDARRREQLATMIDNMAGEAGSKKNAHSFWWWSARVAAAACVLFFISTAVRVWFIPTEPEGVKVAEATPPGPPQWGTESLALIDSTIAAPVKPAAPHRVVPHPNAVPTTEPTVEETPEPIEEVTLPVIEDLIAEEVDIQEAEPEEEPGESAVESIAAPVVSIAYNEPQEQSQEQPRRRSIFSGLFRQPEPDDMTGTVLAIRIL